MLLDRIDGGFRATVPCKLNLLLEVLGRRQDGYHDLDTIMIAVSLCDVIEVTSREDDSIRLQVDFAKESTPLCEGDSAWDVPSDPSNLVVRALFLLREQLQLSRRGLNIRLFKRIPSQAGLGGGSGDAAAALVLGSLVWTGEYQEKIVEAAAGCIGSDLNFFLEGHNGTAWLARCTGRGEKVCPLKLAYPVYFVIVHPPVGCNTGEVFRKFQHSNRAKDATQANSALRMVDCLAEESIESLGFHLLNQLEDAAKETTDWIERSAMRIDRYNPLGQCLSGSGSARFCLCSSMDEAEKIASELKLTRDMRVYTASTWFSPSIQEQAEILRRGS